MPATFQPRLDILPSGQRWLWEELAAIPDHFTLYGGTAIALYLGHRESIDFDFFGTEAFDPDHVLNRVPFLRDSEVIQREADTLTCLVDRDGPVQVSFFGVPGIGQAAAPVMAADIGLKVASLLDLGGMKVSVVQKRAQVKDYLDIDALLQHGLSLGEMLAAGAVIYGRQFNPQISLKALSYFEDGDVVTLPDKTRHHLQDAVRALDPGRLPVLAPFRARADAP